ncbi:hypothetical protein AB0929_02045 [Streptomyces massasporeus]|uniref:hypothetical protein n=1 Tax=Streptomyces massasporeus TaxID=67324 RepID=UPI003451137A
MQAATAEAAEAWVRAAVVYKRLPGDSPLIGEEWITGPYPVLTSLGALTASITALGENRSPVDGFSFGQHLADGSRSASCPTASGTASC